MPAGLHFVSKCSYSLLPYSSLGDTLLFGPFGDVITKSDC